MFGLTKEDDSIVDFGKMKKTRYESFKNIVKMLVSIRASNWQLLIVAVLCIFVMFAMRDIFTLNNQSQNASEIISLKELLVASIEASQRGGKMVRKVKNGGDLHIESKGKTHEGVNDPVTIGDMLSHKQMYYSILKMWPNLHVVSEEKTQTPNLDEVQPIDLNTDIISKKLGSDLNSDVLLKDVTVWIDPLDATNEYTQDLLEFVTTMVCVAYKGEPIIGVIHRPFVGDTIWAWNGHGRSIIPGFQTNQKEVHNSNMKIIVSLSHAGKVQHLATKAFGDQTEVISAGGAGFKALTVAQRKVNAYIHTTAIKKWDICAGNALLKAIGGDMTDLLGNKIDYSHPGVERKNVKLENGLLATFKDHSNILKKLTDAKE